MTRRSKNDRAMCVETEKEEERIERKKDDEDREKKTLNEKKTHTF